MTIQAKLQAIQAELKAPKGQYNGFGKYKYRSCEDILEAVKPLLDKQSCILTISDELLHVGDRYYIVATAALADGEESIAVTAAAREEETKKGMDASQITGAASSYARKYALNGLFCIDDTKDADATNTHGKKEEPEYTGSDDDPLGTQPVCAYCSQPIIDAKHKGKAYSARQIAAISQQKYGLPLHIGCAEKYLAAKEGKKDA